MDLEDDAAHQYLDPDPVGDLLSRRVDRPVPILVFESHCSQHPAGDIPGPPSGCHRLYLLHLAVHPLVRSLVKLGLPFEWGLVLAIGLRYIPTFYGLYTVVSEAQQARALDLTRGNFFTRVRSYLPILVAMIISALRTSEQLARAMESRALGLPGVKRTCLRDIRFRPADCFYAALLIAVFSVLFTLRFQFGFVTHPLYLL
jgi:hypothetical protein